MIVILFLNSFIGTVEISSPSMQILPLIISTILLNERQIVLFPAPVRPTIPIFSPGFTSKVNPLKTVSVVGLYFKWTC